MCDPKGRDCIERNFAKSFNCSTTCVGIYADVQWKKLSLEGGAEDNEKYKMLVAEYRRFKENIVKHFKFNRIAHSSAFSEFC